MLPSRRAHATRYPHDKPTTPSSHNMTASGGREGGRPSSLVFQSACRFVASADTPDSPHPETDTYNGRAAGTGSRLTASRRPKPSATGSPSCCRTANWRPSWFWRARSLSAVGRPTPPLKATRIRCLPSSLSLSGVPGVVYHLSCQPPPPHPPLSSSSSDGDRHNLSLSRFFSASPGRVRVGGGASNGPPRAQRGGRAAGMHLKQRPHRRGRPSVMERARP